MTDELFHKIVDEAVELGVTKVTPFLNGEPFMFPRLFEWLDYLEAKGLRYDIYTNASMMTKEKADKINTYKNIDLLAFSVHGYDKKSYESQMKLDYDKVKENIKYFISIAQIPYEVYMLLSETNKPGVEEFKKEWGDKVFFGKYVNWAGKRPTKLEGTQQPCERMLNEMVVYWDGRVALCCMDSDAGVILGDLNTQSIKDIWNSNAWMRNRHRQGDFDMTLCRDCNFNRI